MEQVFGIRGTKDLLDLAKTLNNKFSTDIREIVYLRTILTTSWMNVFRDFGVFDSTGDNQIFYKKIEKDINKYYKHK